MERDRAHLSGLERAEMHPEHEHLLQEIRGAAKPASHGGFDLAAYSGSPHAFHGLSVPDRRAIARAWRANHKAMPAGQLVEVLDSLFAGASHDEKTVATMLLALHKTARQEMGPDNVDHWLGRLVGWAEVDSLCQNIFTAEEMLADWPAWGGLIERLAGDANINKRRAALVLLVGPVRCSDDERFATLALANVEWLKAERDILITKAVSWLLRSLIARHRGRLTAYLEENDPSLPRIAVRETRAKLQTGRKGKLRV